MVFISASKEVKQSKYILVEHKGKEWVVRTRNPFLVGEVYVGPVSGQITFDLWPQAVVNSLDEEKIDTLTASMARWYHHAKGYPYSRVPDNKTNRPDPE